MVQRIVENPTFPSAAPSDADIERWLALPAAEQEKRLEEALRAGFESGVSTRTIDEIIAAARARLTRG